MSQFHDEETPMAEGLQLGRAEIELVRRIEERLRRIENRVHTIANQCPVARRIERGEP